MNNIWRKWADKIASTCSTGGCDCDPCRDAISAESAPWHRIGVTSAWHWGVAVRASAPMAAFGMRCTLTRLQQRSPSDSNHAGVFASSNRELTAKVSPPSFQCCRDSTPVCASARLLITWRLNLSGFTDWDCRAKCCSALIAFYLVSASRCILHK